MGKVLSFCFKKGVQKLYIFVNIEIDIKYILEETKNCETRCKINF